MKGHIITPEGREIASTKAAWDESAEDWQAMAAFVTCPGCTTPKGQAVNHAANGVFI